MEKEAAHEGLGERCGILLSLPMLPYSRKSFETIRTFVAGCVKIVPIELMGGHLVRGTSSLYCSSHASDDDYC